MRICLSHQKELHWQTTTRIVHLQKGDNILRDIKLFQNLLVFFAPKPKKNYQA